MGFEEFKNEIGNSILTPEGEPMLYEEVRLWDDNAAMNLMKQLGAASPEVKPVDCLQSQMPCGIGDRTKQEFNSAHLCVERK